MPYAQALTDSEAGVVSGIDGLAAALLQHGQHLQPLLRALLLGRCTHSGRQQVLGARQLLHLHVVSVRSYDARGR